MARAPVAIQQGFLYQAYYFWLNAARLFQSQSKVKLVGYEINGAKAFDDVHVEYLEPHRCRNGGAIEKDFFQLKFHVDHSGSIGYKDLIDPGFIGAKSVSFLQRVHELRKSNSDFALKSRFQLYTPWAIDPNDPLRKLVSTVEGELRIDKLIAAGGPKSELGAVKEEWKGHLKISDDEELYATLRPLRIRQGDDLDKLRQAVSDLLQSVGLKAIDFAKSGDEYPGLIFRLCSEGRDKFTREELLAELKRDGLVQTDQPSKPPIRRFAIRSFFREYEFLQDVSERLLAIEEYFDRRYILDPTFWNNSIKQDLMSFAKSSLTQQNSPLELYLDVHSSIAFAAGSLVTLKDRVDISPVQKTRSGEVVWKVSDDPPKAERFKTETLKLGDGPEVAVCLNITWSVTEDVKKFIASSLPQVGELIVMEPTSGPGQSAVKGADHAWAVSEEVSGQLKAVRSSLDMNLPIHFFNAAPNSVLFFAGRMSAPAGKLNLYEFDFDKKRHGTYELSVTLPWK